MSIINNECNFTVFQKDNNISILFESKKKEEKKDTNLLKVKKTKIIT